MATQEDSQHVSDVHDEKTPRVTPNDGTAEEIATAVRNDIDGGLWQNVRRYPHAVAWSACLSTAVIMEGFDILLIQSLLAVGAFQRQFGEQLPDGSYQVTAAWQAGFTNSAIVGEMLGLMINGVIADRYGFKKTMIGALAATTVLIFIPFFAASPFQLLFGLILMGVPWGVFQTLTTTYAAEICPTSLRPYLTTYVNLCWVIGQFIASGVLVGVQDRQDQWAYKIPYALQWIWPVPLIAAIAFAPESPWWLVRKNQLDKATTMLKRLRKNESEEDISATLEMMRHTNEFEKQVNEGTSYLDCFKGIDLRRTEIACVTWLIQTTSGATFMGYSTYFYEAAGLDTDHAFSMSFGQYALGGVGVIISWSLMSQFGRRPLYVLGLATLAIIFLIIGCLGLVSESNTTAQWAIGSMLLLFTFVYDCTIGPLTYALVAEMPSTRLRQKTVVLARNAYNAGSIVANILVTRQLNPGAWDWGAKAGFFWAASCLMCLSWAYFRLPEPKDRSFAEMDLLFERRTSARKFQTTVLHIEELEMVTLESDKGRASLEHVEEAGDAKKD